MKNETCCPKLKVSDWDDKMLNWQNKNFVVGKVRTFFYMPVNFGKVITKLINLVTAEGGELEQNLCLSDHLSIKQMNILLAVNKKINGVENITLTGKFYSKVYEGPFKDTGRWCANFEKVLASKKLTMEKMYMWYTTCPKCAKKYGHNYTVIIAKVA